MLAAATVADSVLHHSAVESVSFQVKRQTQEQSHANDKAYVPVPVCSPIRRLKKQNSY